VTNLHWFCSKPTPYNDYLFKSINAEQSLRLTVYFRTNVDSSHPWKNILANDYRAAFYNTRLGIDWGTVCRTIKAINTENSMIIAGWDHFTVNLVLFLYRVFGGMYILITDTPNLSKRRGFLKKLLRQWWLTWLFSGANKILGTGTQALEVLKIMGAKDNQLLNFPYWIDIARYGKDDVQLFDIYKSHLYRFLSAGRIENDLKGHDLAIRALSEIKNKFPFFKFEYRIAGTGPDEEKLKKLVVQLGISQNVIFLGWLEQNQIIEEMKKTIFFIHPSPTLEPYGVAVLEAMASGMIVFASDKTGAALDRIEHRKNGFLHSAGNINQLANQIICATQLDKKELANMRLEAWNTSNKWPISRALEILNTI
jgi:glycosyltransferase involved in cell wall biosynthesis